MTSASAGAPTLDTMAVLAAMQDQLDQLTAAVSAQQDTIDRLLNERRG